MVPYLINSRKELETLSTLSKKSINDGFTFIGSIPDRSIDIYENNSTGALLAGMMSDRFYIILSLTCEERSLYVKSMQLSNKRKHIKLVLVSKEATRSSVARDVYLFITQHYDLVSDRIQYLGAKDLWKSIAIEPNINVYIFDETKKDYIRDKNEKIISYDGDNISDDEIWGDSEEHQHRLLVATKRKFT